MTSQTKICLQLCPRTLSHDIHGPKNQKTTQLEETDKINQLNLNLPAKISYCCLSNARESF